MTARKNTVGAIVATMGLALVCGLPGARADAADDPWLDRLVRSYRAFIHRVDRGTDGEPLLVMKNGAQVPWDDGKTKTFDQRLAAPDLQDQMSMEYPAGAEIRPPAIDFDPGRVRVEAFFQAVYGDTPEAVEKNLVQMPWMPAAGGTPLRFNRQNGAAEALGRVSATLEKMPRDVDKYVVKTAGTFNWRRIAGTDRLSAHSFGIAVDIDVRHSDYWRWSVNPGGKMAFKNRIPPSVVRAFEDQGFIWGGRWYHYDTMHFEYRPELFDGE